MIKYLADWSCLKLYFENVWLKGSLIKLHFSCEGLSKPIAILNSSYGMLLNVYYKCLYRVSCYTTSTQGAAGTTRVDGWDELPMKPCIHSMTDSGNAGRGILTFRRNSRSQPRMEPATTEERGAWQLSCRWRHYDQSRHSTTGMSGMGTSLAINYRGRTYWFDGQNLLIY